MKLLSLLKDGGPASHVWGYFLIEWKAAFSIVLLRFEHGSRDAWHTHAFGAVSWLLRGALQEQVLGKDGLVENIHWYKPSLLPIWTPRDRCHKVISTKTSWVLSFRGPWTNYWREFIPSLGWYKFTHGRKVIGR
jgi:hypothetical protein